MDLRRALLALLAGCAPFAAAIDDAGAPAADGGDGGRPPSSDGGPADGAIASDASDFCQGPYDLCDQFERSTPRAAPWTGERVQPTSTSKLSILSSPNGGRTLTASLKTTGFATGPFSAALVKDPFAVVDDTRIEVRAHVAGSNLPAIANPIALAMLRCKTSSGSGSGNELRVGIALGQNGVVATTSSGSPNASSSSPPASFDAWHDYVLTIESKGDVTLLVDGIPAEQPPTPLVESLTGKSCAFQVGIESTTQIELTAMFDDLRIR